ncbi:MAG: PQQ-dependent sugar dehydrogenase [Mycolicibacterium sp.]|uniref:PQQ-dependent sugar dehydrogenase n=1 Tax=Mycolicibacterium sp. TaxID=2320850 RepID=UPI003D0C874F
MTSAHHVQQIGAKYIGRVGALAFALGVGAAIAGGSGVAWAEPAESTQSSDSTDGPTVAAAESEAGLGAGGTDESTDDGDGADAESADADTTEAEAEAEADADAEETLPDIPADEDSDGALATISISRQEESAPPEADPATPAGTLAVSQANGAGAEPVAVGRETDSAEPAPTLAAAAIAEPVAAAEPLGLLGWIERTFFNKTPTLTYNPLENSVVDGVIVGNLKPTDPDSEVLTYTTTQPTYGAVEVLSDGTFRYTPGPNYVGHDTFRVTVSDAFGNGFQLHGFAQLLHILTFGLLGSAGHSSTTTINIGFERTAVASGLNTPTDFQFLPDGQVIIAEKGGAIKVIEDGEPQAESILDVPVSTEVERGISGLALDPDYASNGYLYVAYTTTGLRNRLSRFTVTDGVGDLGSELVLAQADQPIAPNHHGGALGFGLDGKLYWGLGDNALRANSQNLSTLHGKILRLNPDGTVPADNPFLDIDALPQIFATGVRNPFRLTVAPDGSVLVADVGAAAFEELNKVTAGGNYGWPDAEGVCGACDSIDPIHAYPHGAGGAAITSVLVPHGSTFGASLDGKVLIADYLKGWIKVLTCDAGFSVCGQEQFFDPQAGRTVKLAQGPDGNIYQLTLDGMLYRIAPSDAASPPED